MEHRQVRAGNEGGSALRAGLSSWAGLESRLCQAAQLGQEVGLGYFLLRTRGEVDLLLVQWHGAGEAAELSASPSAVEKWVSPTPLDLDYLESFKP